MCALIDDENGKWIEDRVVGEFSPHKATAILRIPLSSTRAEDKLIWTATPNGCYSTKSAYHLISTEAAKKIPGPSNTIAHKKFWLDIWQLKVPNKIRHFIWRATNRSLPKKKKKNLLQRNITANALCDRCSSETKDTIHAIWGCAEVKSVWWEMEHCRLFLAEKLVCFRDLFQGILAQNIPHLAELFAYISWNIWYNRNAQRVGTTAVTLERIYSDAVDRLHEFQMAQDNLVQQQVVAHPTHWLPPPPNQYKANSDGAIFKDSGTTGLGVVVRDSEGMVIAALLERIALPPTVEDVEALACRRAISFSIELGLQDVIFEGDSEIIHKHLILDSPCLATFGHIIDDSCRLISSLRSASFTHVWRKGNIIVDKLAKLAKFLYEPQIWLEDIHCDVTNFVLLDKSLMFT